MMARKFLFLLPLMAGSLAGCGWFSPSRPAESAIAESPVEARCRAEARQAPEVLKLREQLYPGNLTNQDRVNREMTEAEQKARQACLVRAGVARGGGVEPVRRSGLFY